MTYEEYIDFLMKEAEHIFGPFAGCKRRCEIDNIGIIKNRRTAKYQDKNICIGFLDKKDSEDLVLYAEKDDETIYFELLHENIREDEEITPDDLLISEIILYEIEELIDRNKFLTMERKTYDELGR